MNIIYHYRESVILSVLSRNTRWYPRVWIFILPLAVTIVLTRLYLGVQCPVDILASWMLAIARVTLNALIFSLIKEDVIFINYNLGSKTIYRK